MSKISYIRWSYADWLGGKISRRPAIEQALFINMQALIMREGGPIAMAGVNLLDMADRLQIDEEKVVSALSNLVKREIVIKVEPDLYLIKFLETQFDHIRAVGEVRRQAALTRHEKAQAPQTKAQAGQRQAIAPKKDANADTYSRVEQSRVEQSRIEKKSGAVARFVPPSIEEVGEYSAKRRAEGKPPVEPEQFVDYYTSQGWKVGKNPMKDWKAAFRQWESKRKQDGWHEPKPGDPAVPDHIRQAAGGDPVVLRNLMAQWRATGGGSS